MNKPTLLSTQVIAAFFSDHVNWDHFYSAVDTLGDSLNSEKNRFDKSDILELAMEVFSDGKIKHHNEIGRDLFIPDLNTFCEMKYETEALFTKKEKKKQSVSLALVNTMGSNNRDKLPVDYAPFLIAVGSRGCAVVDKVTLEEYLDTKADSGQIQAKGIPIDKFTFVRTPDQVRNRKKIKNINYMEAKLALQKQFLMNFKKLIESSR